MELNWINNYAKYGSWGDYLYPLNPSLGDEMRRLFQVEIIPENNNNAIGVFQQSKFFMSEYEDASEEFKANGVDVDVSSPPSLASKGPRAIVKMTRSSTNKYQERKIKGECVFCRNNGECSQFYQSHLLKDRNGKVTCPILRAYVCPICGSTGDAAHTIRYCSQNKNKEAVASIVKLKSMRKSGGRH